MNIKTIVVGDLKTNCYLLTKGNYALVIDPGAEGKKILDNIDSSIKVVGIIITHSHDDHTGAMMDVFNKYNCPIYTGNNMVDGKYNIENFTFNVIHTPGHMDDSITIYFKEEKIMFVGDFIFKGGIGRTDMAGASPYDMKESIKKILTYPLDITLYPGHFHSTTLGSEVNNLNYFLNII